MSAMYPKTLRAWKKLQHDFVVLQDRANSRIELRNLSDRILLDIGVSRNEERGVPFVRSWMS